MSEQYKPTDLPKSMDIVIHTHYCYNSEYGWHMGTISHDTYDKSGDAYICVAKTPLHVAIETPSNMKEMVLEALEAEKKKQMAEYHKKMFELQEKIDSLLCLEYQPTITPATDCENEVPF